MIAFIDLVGVVSGMSVAVNVQDISSIWPNGEFTTMLVMRSSEGESPRSYDVSHSYENVMQAIKDAGGNIIPVLGVKEEDIDERS